MSELLDECEAVPLDLESLPAFDRDALSFFIRNDVVDDPFIDFSFREDISCAHLQFLKMKERLPNATFTAFLFWCAAKSLCETRHTNFRHINGIWYELKNPPFFMPFETGGESRLGSAVFKNVKNMTFDDFLETYLSVSEKARRGELASFAGAELYALAHNMVNLPNLRFSSVKAHVSCCKSAHVWWLMGQRHEEADKLQVPMTIRMHHANGDPVILNRLLTRFRNYISKLEIN